MNRYLSHLSLEHIALNTDEVSNVKELLEDLIIQLFIFSRTYIITGNIYLYSSFTILNLCKRSLTHDATTHHSSCNRYFSLLILIELLFYISRVSVGWELCCWVWINAHLAQFLQALTTSNLLL